MVPAFTSGGESSSIEGSSEAAGAQCLLAAKSRGRLVVWEQCRMGAGTVWPGEEGSGKQLSESEFRVKSCWEDRAHRVASRSCCVTLGKGPPLSEPQFTLPWKDIGFHHIWGPAHLRYSIRSHRRGRPKDGPQPPEFYPFLPSESWGYHHSTLTWPGLPPPSFYNLPSLSSSSVEQDKEVQRPTSASTLQFAELFHIQDLPGPS